MKDANGVPNKYVKVGVVVLYFFEFVVRKSGPDERSSLGKQNRSFAYSFSQQG